MKTAAQLSNNRIILASVGYWLILIFFAVMFVVMSLTQFMDHDSFSHELSLDPGLSGIAPALAWIIPNLQLLIVLSYFSDKYRQTALWATTGLLCAYMVYIGLMLAFFESSLTAYCQGFLWFTWTDQLITNLLLIILSSAAVYLGRRASGKRNAPASPHPLKIANH